LRPYNITASAVTSFAKQYHCAARRKNPVHIAVNGVLCYLEEVIQSEPNYSAILASFAYFSSAYFSAFWKRTSALSGNARVRLL